jgi:hypothetical protein
MFKPNVSPLLLDQMPHTTMKTKILKSGEKIILDPEATTERAMLWFYLLINIGGFMQVATAYAEKYVGWWLAFILPVFLYLPLPLLLVSHNLHFCIAWVFKLYVSSMLWHELAPDGSSQEHPLIHAQWWLHKRLVLHPPVGSDLPNVMRVLGICLRNGGLFKIGRHGFWEPAKPSVIAARGLNIKTRWNDEFVEDVRRTFQATGIFCFFPIQYLNDNGIGSAAAFLSTMLTTNGVPNDVINNFNTLSIIVCAPLLNYGLYPLLRRFNIHYGPVARITTGLLMSSIGGVGYTVLNYYAYKQGPCGKFGSSTSCVDADGVSLVSSISIWVSCVIPMAYIILFMTPQLTRYTVDGHPLRHWRHLGAVCQRSSLWNCILACSQEYAKFGSGTEPVQHCYRVCNWLGLFIGDQRSLPDLGFWWRIHRWLYSYRLILFHIPPHRPRGVHVEPERRLPPYPRRDRQCGSRELSEQNDQSYTCHCRE